MESSRSNINQWLSRILLIAIIATSSVVMYAINEIDKIINGDQVGQLYHYSLQFSLDWANPYWGFTQIIYISLGATIIMSTVVLLLGFIKTKKPISTITSLKPEKSMQKLIQAAPIAKPVPKPQEVTIIQHKPEPATTQTIKAKPVEIKTKTTNKTTATEPAQANSTCPSCKKGFSQPLVMLDFEGGKSKLVNVCPYCNQVLGDTEQKIEE